MPERARAARMHVKRLAAFYQELTPASVGRLHEFYSRDAWFKDPFNEVRGAEAIARIFTHMFRQLEAPRFVVTESIGTDNAMLAWELRYRSGGGEAVIRGVSHLKFGADGKVCYHRDYWDTAEELYLRLPVLGSLLRLLRRRLAA